ncbi:MAG: hypothetical protein DHS20C17_00310 [Cyclobacteriaceae bacterium]|nr:MAG: hypothetical protein DHS20C17_00310 [Cyclobacteriaceae bacterium]
MSSEEKKSFLLLKSMIFHYHGLDEDEVQILERTAKELNADAELKWANDFIAEDYGTAFNRARNYLKDSLGQLEKSMRLSYLDQVWKDNYQKGYITEMEATAMLEVAKDLGIESELISMVRG